MFGLDALGKIKFDYRFASSELRCLPLGRKLGVKIACGNWYPPIWCRTIKRYRLPGNDEAHFWLNGYVNKQNCRIWSEANPQVYVETPLHPEKLTVWCALWAGGILLQKR
ncbi:hypothetical protein TNCV_3862601 [Trichonephila clavipes]|uniref:Uncharacterized protein n=1 Tax=Trichonephila clavipes TaxID=2585209 RepID=A0A8X6S793_TRICX|nr:hypothetical protein TNCV_3862601 [Trichonephila clavipes]